MTRYAFKKTPKLFRQFKHLPIAWMFVGLGSLCSPVMNTLEALPKVVSGTIMETQRGDPLQHREMQKLYTIIHSEGFLKICLILH